MNPYFDFLDIEWTVQWNTDFKVAKFICIDNISKKILNCGKKCPYYDICFENFVEYWNEDDLRCHHCKEYRLELPAIRFFLNIRKIYPHIPLGIICCNCMKELIPIKERITINLIFQFKRILKLICSHFINKQKDKLTK